MKYLFLDENILYTYLNKKIKIFSFLFCLKNDKNVNRFQVKIKIGKNNNKNLINDKTI